jgi:hypothetical protein
MGSWRSARYLYTAVVFDNLQQDVARGGGQYLVSLGVLLDIPLDRRQEWALFTQSQYSVLFASDRQKAKEIFGRAHSRILGYAAHERAEPALAATL